MQQILFGNTKGWGTATSCNMGEPWKHRAKSKEPVTPIVGFHLHEMETESSYWGPMGIQGEWGVTANGWEVYLGGDEM